MTWLEKPKNLWLLVAAYTIVVGLLVQLVLLPYVFPVLHDGDGLIRGMDGKTFHRVALITYEKVTQSGWSEWTLQPGGQLVSGVAAIFYVLIAPKPWSVLPLNAVLNATSAVCILFVLRSFSTNARLTLLSVLPFIIFPSNLLWNTQFHNENYAVTGFAMLLFGLSWIIKTDLTALRQQVWPTIRALAAILLGGLMLALVRFEVYTGLVLLVTVTTFLAALFYLFQPRTRAGVPVRIAALAAAVLIVVGVRQVILPLESTREAPASQSTEETGTTTTSTSKTPRWQATEWLPEELDRQFSQIAAYRRKFIKSWAHGGSSIDHDVVFTNAAQVLQYLPRAAQIAFLSPFPSMWFTSGHKLSGELTRALSAFEMMAVYLFLAGLPVFIWRHRSDLLLWALLLICTGMLLVYATTIPNVGALYRFRYPYLMPLVCLGLMGWLELRRSRSVRMVQDLPA